MTEGQRVLIKHLADDAERHEREARELGDVKKEEYFRGVAAAFIATLTLLED